MSAAGKPRHTMSYNATYNLSDAEKRVAQMEWQMLVLCLSRSYMARVRLSVVYMAADTPAAAGSQSAWHERTVSSSSC